MNGVTVSSRSGSLGPAERALATAVLTVPSLGTALALALAVGNGIGALEVGLFAATYAVTLFGITAGFHRMLAHRAFRTSNAVRWLLLGAGSMAAQGPPLYWVATHRHHHAVSDRRGDPHSPHEATTTWRGFMHAHLLWMLRHDGGDVATYARDLLKDRLVFRVDTQYPLWMAAGVMLPAVIGYLMTGTARGALAGALWGGLVRCFVVHHLSWSIASLCHIFGRRPYQTRDSSGNLPWLAPVTFGEAYHNNHHAFPSSAALGLEWWEIDVAGWILRGLARLGLIWDLRIPSRAERRAARLRGYAATELGRSSRWRETA